MNWHFSRALVEEFSAATCSDGAPCVPSNLNHMPQLFSSSDRMMDFCGRSLCGMTCAPLTESLGAELLTLFRAVFPVRTSAQQDAAPASPANTAACGEKWRASFAKWDRASFSWKTPPSLPGV